MKSRRWSNRTWSRCALLLILAAALLLRLRGVDWPRFHPDETPISRWIAAGGPDRVYPGGMFILIRPFRFLWESSFALNHQLRQLMGSPAAGARTAPDYVLMGRIFNVLIGTLTCLFVYLAGLTITRSRTAALLSAGLMAFAQYHVEHCHYAESDIAMVLLLSISFWCWAKCIATRGKGWFAGAALAGGFAAGTKFTLATLIPPWLLFCLLYGWQEARTRKFFGCAKYFGAGALLFLVGFVAATPQSLSPRSFIEGLNHEATMVYRETRLNMGMLAGDRAVRMGSHLRDLFRYAISLGPGWLALWLSGLLFLINREYRKFWIPLLGVPLLYTYYWIVMSPWVRTQEFLNYLPFAAVTATLPLVVLWRRYGLPVKIALAAAALTAAAGAYARGARVSSIFAWKDSRLLAERWLERHGPETAVFGLERYATVSPPGPARPVDMVARTGLPALREMGLDYVLSQGTRGHRGMAHPVTRELYPYFEERYREFLAGTELLRTWGYLPPRETHATFAAWNIQLFGLHRRTPEASVPWVLPQPALVTREPMVTFFPRGHHLAGALALEIDKNGAVGAVGNDEEWTGPVYAVVYTRERPANIRLRGFGRGFRLSLSAYDAAVVPLVRPAWRPRLGHREIISVRAEPVQDITYIPAFLRVAFSREEADRVVEELGYGRTRAAEEVAAQPEELDRLRSLPPEALAYRGIGVPYYDQFARIRLPGNMPDNTFELRLLQADPAPSGEGEVFSARFQPWLKRISAPFTLRFDILVDPADRPDDEEWPLRIYEESSGTLLGVLEKRWSNSLWHTGLALEVPAGTAGIFNLRIEAPRPGLIRLRNVSIEWTFADVLDEEFRRAAISQAAAGIEADLPEEALFWLDRVETRPGDSYHLKRSRLRLTASALTHGSGSEKTVAAARDLLALAPNHYRAWSVLDRAGYPEARQTLDRLTPDLALEAEFPPFAKLVGVSHDEERGTATIWLEALTDRPPPLAVQLYRRRRKRWRARDLFPITDRSLVAQGERFPVTIALPADGRPETEYEYAFRLASAVRWHPGPLPAADRESGLVAFAEWVGVRPPAP